MHYCAHKLPFFKAAIRVANIKTRYKWFSYFTYSEYWESKRDTIYGGEEILLKARRAFSQTEQVESARDNCTSEKLKWLREKRPEGDL